MREQTLNKLSAALDGWLRQKTGANVVGGAAKLLPLLDDLQKSAWFLDARVAPDGKPEIAVAVKLNDTRSFGVKISLRFCKLGQVWVLARQVFFSRQL